MSIMNKKNILLTVSLMLSLCGYGQIYDRISNNWVEGMYYPVSATQFEQNIGVKDLFFTSWGVNYLVNPNWDRSVYIYDASIYGTFWFCSGNLALSIEIPFGYIKNNKEDVKSITIKKYKEVARWEEKNWEEQETKTYQFENDKFLINGASPIPKHFSILNSGGEKEKIYNDGYIRFKYQRDELGRVVMVYNYSKQTLKELYKYVYSHPSDSNRITKIQKFTSEGKCIETVEFIYDGQKLMVAKLNNTSEQMSIKYSYNAQGDVVHIHQYEQKKYYNPHNTEYDFSYVYSDGKINSCKCRWGTQSNQFENWDFKYDSKGNWIELIEEGSKTKWVREINYGQ